MAFLGTSRAERHHRVGSCVSTALCRLGYQQVGDPEVRSDRMAARKSPAARWSGASPLARRERRGRRQSRGLCPEESLLCAATDEAATDEEAFRKSTNGGRLSASAGNPQVGGWSVPCCVVGFLLLVASAVLLTAGSELFAEHASAAGRRFGVTALAIGLVLAGAEPEEMVTAIFASARHLPGIAAGDAIGANVTMLTVVLGLAALARPLKISGRVRTYALAASAAGVAAALCLLGGSVGRALGAALVVAYLVAVAVVWWIERRPPAFGEAAEIQEHDEGSPAGRDSRAAALVVVGVAAMAGGGWLAVSGAERIVGSLGLAQSVVGLTFVALATTAELFALVWAAYRRGVEELALAGVLGSAVYNATATLGVAALVVPSTSPGWSGRPGWVPPCPLCWSVGSSHSAESAAWVGDCSSPPMGRTWRSPSDDGPVRR